MEIERLLWLEKWIGVPAGSLTAYAREPSAGNAARVMKSLDEAASNIMRNGAVKSEASTTWYYLARDEHCGALVITFEGKIHTVLPIKSIYWRNKR